MVSIVDTVAIYAYIQYSIVSPIISAIQISIVKAVKSAILTLQCNILNKGIPQAIIGWKKDGRKVTMSISL